MNIFYLHQDPKTAAEMHCNKHVVKMILETAQMLCTTIWLSGVRTPYKKTHINHPSTKWTRESVQHYRWLCKLGKELCAEYTYRYDKRHKSEDVIDWCIENEPELEDNGFTQPPQAMPNEYKNKCSIKAYRTYYLNDKKGFLDYKKRNKPEWLNING